MASSSIVVTPEDGVEKWLVRLSCILVEINEQTLSSY